MASRDYEVVPVITVGHRWIAAHHTLLLTHQVAYLDLHLLVASVFHIGSQKPAVGPPVVTYPGIIWLLTYFRPFGGGGNLGWRIGTSCGCLVPCRAILVYLAPKTVWVSGTPESRIDQTCVALLWLGIFESFQGIFFFSFFLYYHFPSFESLAQF